MSIIFHVYHCVHIRKTHIKSHLDTSKCNFNLWHIYVNNIYLDQNIIQSARLNPLFFFFLNNKSSLSRMSFEFRFPVMLQLLNQFWLASQQSWTNTYRIPPQVGLNFLVLLAQFYLHKFPKRFYLRFPFLFCFS